MLELTAQDRCDRCGARAAHEARKHGVGSLLFCNHHYTKHKTALMDNYWLIESTMEFAEPVPVAALTES